MLKSLLIFFNFIIKGFTMQLKHIKESIKNKYSKGCLKGRSKNNRVIYKTQRQKYKEGLKDFYDSLPERDFRGVDKDTLQKYREKYYKTFKVYPKKNMSIIDIKRALKEL